ncbi:MAG: hypothetical protein KGN16_26520 [Burkholderiales bacterium]|nr:hypothetical protein [Burkholderiales bacterium]
MDRISRAARTSRRASRDRLTIELHGLRERLQALAAAERLPLAAMVRKTLIAGLPADDACSGFDDRNADFRGDPIIKVTVRMPTLHALLLVNRARAAGVSQGAYMAGLIEGVPPPPRPGDHARALTALIASTDQLAAIGTDLSTFLRLLPYGRSPTVDSYRAKLAGVHEDIGRHLAQASRFVSELRGARHPR